MKDIQEAIDAIWNMGAMPESVVCGECGETFVPSTDGGADGGETFAQHYKKHVRIVDGTIE